MAITTAITIVGNVTRDPELTFTPAGVPVAKLSVAVNRRYQNQAGDWKDAEPEFFNVVAWRQLAQNVAESIDKGTRVIVAGRLSQRSWETDAGERRSTVEIVADSIGPDLAWATAETTRNVRRPADQPAADESEEPF